MNQRLPALGAVTRKLRLCQQMPVSIFTIVKNVVLLSGQRKMIAVFIVLMALCHVRQYSRQKYKRYLGKVAFKSVVNKNDYMVLIKHTRLVCALHHS